MNGPSEHLSWEELACHDAAKTPYPTKWRSARAMPLAAAFEAIRAVWGLPIRVTSGYRTPRYNAQVGGAERSQHMEGRALDVKPPDGVTLFDFWDTILAMAERLGIGGVGFASPAKGGFVHLDMRPRRRGERVVAWRY